jgi:hypothetical protein
VFGVVTAVFGGVLRDIVCNEIPSAFSDHRPYAVCSFFGGRVLMASQALQAPAWVGSVGAAGVAAGLRMLAFARGYSLPQWSIGDSSTGDAQPGSGPAIPVPRPLALQVLAPSRVPPVTVVPETLGTMHLTYA